MDFILPKSSIRNLIVIGVSDGSQLIDEVHRAFGIAGDPV
jgi:hypothetical protein